MEDKELEKAAHKILCDYGIYSMGQRIGILGVKKLMVKMAKWQSQKMYSEEEVLELFKKYQYDLAQWVLRMEHDINGKPIPTEWFEQFKKK